MKHIKTFENVNLYPLGTYVLCKDFNNDRIFKNDNELIEFISNNIGQIKRYTNYNDGLKGEYKYIIKYKNIPKIIADRFLIDYDNCRAYSDEEIILSAPTIDELEIKINAMKYNI